MKREPLVWPLSVAVAVLGVSGSIAGCAGSDPHEDDGGPRTPIKVMTRNLFLGADLFPVVLSPTVDMLLANVQTFWKGVMASDYPGRAKLLAAEIAGAAPDLVALQEVELYRLQVPSNFSFTTPVIDAPEAAIDFLALLQTELAALGAAYNVAVENTLSDVELPALADDGMQFDLRLTDRDVILVKTGMAAGNPVARAFTKYVDLPLAGMANLKVQMRRGYSSIDVTVGGATVVFADTHLELGGPLAAFQEDQANELAAALGARSGQIILAGDGNSPADGSGSRSYRFLTGTFRDAYAALGLPGSGATCCVDLTRGTLADGGNRIDLVLTRGPVRALDARVIGFDPGAARTASGLVASDHAGVVMTLGIKPAPP